MYQIDTEAEKKEIFKRYRVLMKVYKTKTPEDKKLIKKAFNIAVEAHKDMRRETGEPYIFHPLSVAIIVASEIGLGKTSIICALMHDVVEDTEFTIEDIRGLFGTKVASIIEGLTKIRGIFDQRTTSIQAENFKKILLTLSDDVRVILIKLADRLHNMRTLDVVSREKQLKISSETIHLYAPLAHRLGLHGFKSELHDLALKYTEPEIYNEIKQKLINSAEDRSRFISKFVHPFKKAMLAQGLDFRIYAREKSIYSILEKMRKKEVPFEEIYDIFAIRIIINTSPESEKADCWKVYSIITDYYHPNMDRLRDWISIPKANGYEALHTTVMSNSGRWVEIQIRSKRMDEIAEKGYAAHWKYKESMKQSSQLDHWLDRIREMIENPDTDALSFIDDVKGYFFHDEISVFTPQGELRTLPAGSTILDFAFAIHSEIGNNCIGAKVDKKLVPINYKLKNGEQVEIITSRKQYPREEWLNYVVTTRARTNIRNFLNKEKKKMLKPGKEKLERLFLQHGIEPAPGKIKEFQLFNNFRTQSELFIAVAEDKLGAREVKLFSASGSRSGWFSFIRSSRKKPKQKEKPQGDNNGTDPDTGAEYRMIISGDYEGKDYELATCCNPIPGDEIIGLIASPNLPVEVHRTKCEKATEMISSFSNRAVKIKWNNNGAISFQTGIKLTGIDKVGLINEITRIISSELNLNIKSFHLEAQDGLTEGEIRLYVQDTEILNKLIHDLAQVEGVTKVLRVS